MKTKHSEGPWKKDGPLILAKDGSFVASACRPYPKREGPRDMAYPRDESPREKANSDLLAAAPELLDLLDGLLATAETVDAGNKADPNFNGCGFSPTLFEKCRAIIAKAKGEEVKNS